jgi:hypothetical protein
MWEEVVDVGDEKGLDVEAGAERKNLTPMSWRWSRPRRLQVLFASSI